MRLSMIDHEEHQRKEAENKKKEAAAQARSEGEASSEGRSPGTAASSGLTSLSSSPSVATSFSSSPLATRNSPGSQRSSVLPPISPSRTPPPPSRTSAHPMSDFTSRRHRTPSPTPYSTLNAATSPANTASAFLSGNPRNYASVNANGDMVNGEAIAGSSIPRITIGASNSTPLHISSDIRRQSQPFLQRPNISNHESTSGASIDTSILPPLSYDLLPSSPESSFVHEPLLGSGATSEEHANQ